MQFKFKQWLAGTFSAAILSSQAWAAPIDDYEILTENYPPFNFLNQSGQVVGIATDLMVAMLDKNSATSGRQDIKLIPWSEGYSRLSEKPNTVLFSTTRSQTREQFFKWVGPIAANSTNLISVKAKEVSINSIGDISLYKVGVVAGDYGEELLNNNGLKSSAFNRINGTNAIELALKKLTNNEIDVFAFSDTIKWEMKSFGYNPDDFESAFKLEESQLYFAFSLATPDSIIKELQSHLDALKADGTYDAIVNKYLK